MTDTSMIDQVDERAAHDVEHEDHHTTDLLYIKIAVGLAFLTALEVAWPYFAEDVLEDRGPILMWPLLVVMAIKFAIIAAFFMHLKFDNKILTRIFYSGLLLAVAVYVIALTTFQIWTQ